MRRSFCSFMLALFAVSTVVIPCTADTPAKTTAEILKQQERNTVSLELEFTKKSPNALQRVISFLNWGPNGYATGFMVGGHLMMTAYHVVSGDLDDSKKLALGFAREDHLEVKVYLNGCKAKVLKVDPEADLALLEACSEAKQSATPLFQATVTKNEKLMLIARPHGDRIVSQGTFYGAYAFRGIDYWSVKITARDGFSGSPVYNEQGEVVGVFSGYDWSKKLAVVSPGMRAQKLIAAVTGSTHP